MENVKLAKASTKERLRLGLVGSDTLLGKEIEEILKDRTGATILDFAANGEGNFGEVEGEAVYVEALGKDSIAEARALIVAGVRDGADKAYELGRSANGKLPVIDCTGLLATVAESKLVAPLVTEVVALPGWLLEIAHPAASAVALVIKRLARYRRIEQVIATVFEPASEQGKRGVAELHQQTTNLLSFKPLEKQVFDSQLSFNLLSQYGEDSAVKLASVEERLGREIASILDSDPAIDGSVRPSLRVVGAPVFHGYSLSLWIRFADRVSATELGEALASAQIEVRSPGEEPPDSVSAASQSGLIAGDIRVDRNDERAAWLWVVGDNLRLTADAVADVVAQLQRQPQ